MRHGIVLKFVLQSGPKFFLDTYWACIKKHEKGRPMKLPGFQKILLQKFVPVNICFVRAISNGNYVLVFMYYIIYGF